MRYLIVFMLLCGVCYGYEAPEYNEKVPNKGWVIQEIIRQIEARKNPKVDLLFERGVNLNDVLSKHPELRLPLIPEEQSYLAISEYCPNCGGFSYYHRAQGIKRTCCRCYAVWTRELSGNYWVTHQQ